MAERGKAEGMVAGIDGCRAGWIAALSCPGGDLAFHLHESLEELLKKIGPERIYLDMPIGTAPPGQADRACDLEARRFLGGRAGASLFSPPCAEAIEATSYAEALALHRQCTGKGFSVQAWNLVPKIREVAKLLRDSPDLLPVIDESHPEVCLRALAPGRLFASKHSAEGRAQRREIISAWIPAYERRHEEGMARFPRSRVKEDDLLDAAVLAVAASHPPAFFPSTSQQGAPSIAYPHINPRNG